MSLGTPTDWWRRYRALSKQSVPKTLLFAFMVASVCAVIVTTSAVLLEPRFLANLEADRTQRLLDTLRSLPGMQDVVGADGATDVHLLLLDLQRGELLPDADAEAFDSDAAAADPDTSVDIPPKLDQAGIKRRAKLAAVYLLGDVERPHHVVLPVYGVGYQSVVRAFLVLEGDLSTIAALAVYAHQETAGVGSRITEPEWLAGFRGKRVFSDDGRYALRLSTRGGGGGEHDVDAITGATRSSQAVVNMMAYWLGPHGYRPFLQQLARAKP